MTNQQILQDNIYTANRDPRNKEFNHITDTKAISDAGEPVIKLKLKGKFNGKYWVRVNAATRTVFEERGTDLSVFE